MDLNGWILHRFVKSAGWSFEHIDWISKWHEILGPCPISYIANHDTIKHNRNPSQNLRKRTRALLSPRISQTLPSLLLPSALGLCRQSLCCTLSLEFGCNVHLNQRTSNNHQSVDGHLGLKGVALAVWKLDMKASISANMSCGTWENLGALGSLGIGELALGHCKVLQPIPHRIHHTTKPWRQRGKRWT